MYLLQLALWCRYWHFTCCSAPSLQCDCRRGTKPSAPALCSAYCSLLQIAESSRKWFNTLHYLSFNETTSSLMINQTQWAVIVWLTDTVIADVAKLLLLHSVVPAGHITNEITGTPSKMRLRSCSCGLAHQWSPAERTPGSSTLRKAAAGQSSSWWWSSLAELQCHLPTAQVERTVSHRLIGHKSHHKSLMCLMSFCYISKSQVCSFFTFFCFSVNSGLLTRSASGSRFSLTGIHLKCILSCEACRYYVFLHFAAAKISPCQSVFPIVGLQCLDV